MKTLKRTPALIHMILWALVVATLTTAWVPQAGWAMLAPATESPSAGMDRTQDLQTVQRALENKMIQQRLEDLGLSPEEINAKMDRLSDAQLHQMATQIDALMPGGQLHLLVTILVVLAIILLVVILI
jgi:hypothetical protein